MTLQDFHLDKVKLMGSFPADIGSWSSLVSIRLHDLKLAGTLPRSVRSASQSCD